MAIDTSSNSLAIGSDSTGLAPPDAKGFNRLLFVFTLSGAAGLIYELVWFQLLRLTIGGGSQSLGVLLACFMGGLCAGSLLYARVIPARWQPLRTYALLELGIGAIGGLLPPILSSLSGIYFSHATTPAQGMIWRSALCALALLPPTLLMGATLPAMARWLGSGERPAAQIGRLYAANVVGAVGGVFIAALLLLPRFDLVATNAIAVGLNLCVAVVVLTIRGKYVPPAEKTRSKRDTSASLLPVYLAYAVSGMASLSCEVLWSRLLGSVLGATVYGFALVLGVFLLGLSLGGAAGSSLLSRVRCPRRAFAHLQLGVIAGIGATSFLVPWVADLFVTIDIQNVNNPVTLTLTNLIRTCIVVFPGAFFWGMLFPMAVACLGSAMPDAARPVGRLYAWNTMGAVVGSLATSFLLIPFHGTSMGISHLVLLPFAAALIVLWPGALPAWTSVFPAVGVSWLVFGTGLPRAWCESVRSSIGSIDMMLFLLIAAGPAFLGFELFLVRRDFRRLLYGAAGSALIFAYTTAIPARLYQQGRGYGAASVIPSDDGEIVLFEEGTMEPVVVSHSQTGPLEVSINSILCASTVPDAMEHLRLLGHLPALLSRDPGQSVVIGLGAGVTAGCLGIDQRVQHVQVIELEPKVKLAAAEFGASNHHVMDNPKVDIRIDDGRHFIATTDRKFGVITSDPIEPFWAGSAALYTVEHYQRCREHLIEGGVFCQWLGIFGLDEANVRSLISAFARAFPDGSIWATPSEMLFVGSTGPMRFDIPVLRERLASDRPVAASLAFVGVRSIEELFGRYVCPVISMEDYLRDVKPNRDRNLTVQYTGWQGFYQSRRWNRRIRLMLIAHHQIRREDFLMPGPQQERFFRRVHEEWQEFVEPANWPGSRPSDPTTTTAPVASVPSPPPSDDQ